MSSRRCRRRPSSRTPPRRKMQAPTPRRAMPKRTSPRSMARPATTTAPPWAACRHRRSMTRGRRSTAACMRSTWRWIAAWRSRWRVPTSRRCHDRCGSALATSSTTSANRSPWSTACCKAIRAAQATRWAGSWSTARSASAGCSTSPPRRTSRAAAKTSVRPWRSGAGSVRATWSSPCWDPARCATSSAWPAMRACARCSTSKTTRPASSCRGCSWSTCGRNCCRSKA